MRISIALFLTVSVVRGETDEKTAAARRAVAGRVALDGSARPRLDALAAKLARAQADARAFLFDTARYPTPSQAHRGWRVGVDKQPGHKEMEKRVSTAIRLHNEATGILAGSLSIRTRTVGNKKPTREALEITRPVNHYGILVLDTGVAKFLKSYRARYDAWTKLRGAGSPDENDALLHALGALSRREWNAASRAGAALAGTEAFLWETLRAAALLNWNERKHAGHDANEMDGVRVLNAYRVSLGLPPLVLDKQLHFMARDFSAEMARGKFFSHQHPHDPSRRTLARRSRRAGYRWANGENVSSEGDGPKAVWRWRADAGHHRILIAKAWRGVGLGCVKTSVLNPGVSSTREILALYGAGNARSLRGNR